MVGVGEDLQEFVRVRLDVELAVEAVDRQGQRVRGAELHRADAGDALIVLFIDVVVDLVGEAHHQVRLDHAIAIEVVWAAAGRDAVALGRGRVAQARGMGRGLASRVGDAQRNAQPVVQEGVGIEGRGARRDLAGIGLIFALHGPPMKARLPISKGRGVWMSTVPARPPSSRSDVGDLYTDSVRTNSGGSTMKSNTRLPAESPLALGSSRPSNVVSGEVRGKTANVDGAPFAARPVDLDAGDALDRFRDVDVGELADIFRAHRIDDAGRFALDRQGRGRGSP